MGLHKHNLRAYFFTSHSKKKICNLHRYFIVLICFSENLRQKWVLIDYPFTEKCQLKKTLVYTKTTLKLYTDGSFIRKYARGVKMSALKLEPSVYN